MSASRQRLLLRATLVGAMLLAGLGLFAVIKGRSGGGSATPALARQSLRVKVVDRSGRVVKHAKAFVKTASGAAPAHARWSPEDGVLMLPRRKQPHDLRVLARGYRITDVDGVGGDHTIRLERGYRLRVSILDMPTSGLPKRMRVLVRVRPVDLDKNDPDGLDAKALVDLMDNLGGAGPRRMPRDAWGYAVSVAQARRGILLPRPGRYEVVWGLFYVREDTERVTKGEWQGWPGSAVTVEVTAGEEPGPLALMMTLGDLQATIDGLRQVVRDAAKSR